MEESEESQQEILLDETRDVITGILNGQEGEPSGLTTPDKVSPIVEYGGHCIYKSTLVSQLNGNPFLSKDRLTRVRNSIYFNNSDDYLNAASSSTSCLLGIGSDCGVFFMQERVSSGRGATKKRKAKKTPNGRPSSILQGVDEGTWWLGRVQKMRRRVGPRWGPVKEPIDLLNLKVNDPKNRSADAVFEVYLNWFTKGSNKLKYKYDHSDSVWIDVEAVISTVTLQFNCDTKVYSLDKDDATTFDEFCAKKSTH